MQNSAHQVSDCYWLAGRDPPPNAAPLSGDVKADVAIIGAGYTGLSAAHHLKVANPDLAVAVLEAKTAGFGASGRNAGFVMTLFGASAGLMKALHGKERVRDAHRYMVSAIDALEETIRQNGIECDYARTGFLRVATARAYVSRIRDEIELFQSLGIDDLSWVDSDWLYERVRAPGMLGACWEPNCGSLNPIKWLDGLRGIAIESGVDLYEGSPVQAIRRAAGRYRLETPRGSISAEKVVFATNGYTHLLPGMRTKQIPAFTYVVVTEPLSVKQRTAIGWAGRESIEDGRNYMHYYRLLPDGRLLAGGGPGLVPFGGSMDHDHSPKVWDHLERFIGKTFPALRGLRVEHRWGGAFSVTANMTPQIGSLHGGSAVYAIGCTGHGVAMTHMNGRIVRDLVLGRQTELTNQWFVNKRSLPIPPEPIRSVAASVVGAAMRLDDWWCDRGALRA